MDLLVILGIIVLVWGGLVLLVGGVLVWLGWFTRAGGGEQ